MIAQSYVQIYELIFKLQRNVTLFLKFLDRRTGEFFRE